MMEKKLDLDSLIERAHHSSVQHVAKTVQDQYNRMVVILVIFNPVYDNGNQELWLNFWTHEEKKNTTVQI